MGADKNKSTGLTRVEAHSIDGQASRAGPFLSMGYKYSPYEFPHNIAINTVILGFYASHYCAETRFLRFSEAIWHCHPIALLSIGLSSKRPHRRSQSPLTARPIKYVVERQPERSLAKR